MTRLPYFKEGKNFLGPGVQFACAWDRLENLVASLREKGLYKGIIVTVLYKDLAGRSHQTEWKINPLIYEGNRHVLRQDSQSVEDLLAALKDLLEGADGRPGELKKLEGDGNGMVVETPSSALCERLRWKCSRRLQQIREEGHRAGFVDEA